MQNKDEMIFPFNTMQFLTFERVERVSVIEVFYSGQPKLFGCFSLSFFFFSSCSCVFLDLENLTFVVVYDLSKLA